MTDWVELTKVNGEIDAQLVAGSLENEGIPTRLQKSSGEWRYGAADAFVLIAIFVPAERYAEATEMLDHPAGQPPPEAMDELPAGDGGPPPFVRSQGVRWWVTAVVLIGLLVALAESEVLDILQR